MLERETLRSRRRRKRMKQLKTALQIKAEETTEQPVISLSRVIESISAGTSFGGWGPRVAGSSSIVRNWN